jgi:phage terminase large subunit
MLDRSIYSPSPWSSKYHEATADQVLGGGAAGPGKSLTLLWDSIATQAVIEQARMTGQLLDQFPEWLADLCRKHPIRQGESEGHTLHMRRTMPQLQETIDRSMRMFPKFDPHATYSKELHRWEFATGYKYTFGHCRESNSHEDYLSKQYTALDLDEGYQFEEKQFEELDGRVRTADPVLRYFKRTRIMSNPAPGWLKDTFVTPERKGNVVLRRKVLDPLTGEFEWKTQLFLPATLDDNPDKAFVRDYKFKLLSKPAHMRARYLYGDWDSVEGGYFEDDYNPGVHIIAPFKIPRDWPKFRVMDWGFKTHGVCGWFALDPDENLYLFYEFNFRLMKDAEVAKRIVEIEKKFGFWDEREGRSRLMSSVADTQLWEERGDSGKSKAAVFADHGIYWEPADKASIQRNAERVTERLRDYDERRPPALMVFENCKKTREMLSSIPVDDNDSLIPSKKSPLKHWFDCVAYGAARASRGRGSIVMELHEFDKPDNDNDEPALQRAGSFGYGS